MRPRKWVLVLVALGLLLWLAASGGMRLLRERVDLERVLVGRLAPIIGGPCEVGHLSFGFFSVYLQDVKAVLPLKTLSVHIQDIKVGFSLWRLLCTRGDMGRSISTIVLISPRLTLAMSAPSRAVADTTGRSQPSSPFAAADLPVKYLQIHKGVVCLQSAEGEEFIAGENLDGRLWQENGALRLTCNGRISSLRRNLALDATLAGGTAQSRLSVRLNEARIAAPLRLPGCTISAGTLDGVCEFTMPASALPSQIESSGWVRVSGATVTFKALGRPITSLDAVFGMHGRVCTLDSLDARMDGMRVRVRGNWDLSGEGPSYATLSAANVDIGQLFPHLQQTLSDNLYGTGWLTVDLAREGGATAAELTLSGGGISLLGSPMTQFSGHATLQGRQLAIDSLTMRTAAAGLSVSGVVAATDSTIVHDLVWDCRIDSLPTVPWFRGRLRLCGHTFGPALQPGMDFRLWLDDPKVYGVPLGSQSLTLKGSAARVWVATKGSRRSPWSIHGTLDSLYGSDPRIDATLKVGSAAVGSALTRLLPLTDSVAGVFGLQAKASGRLSAWHADAELSLQTSRVRGQLVLTAAAADSAPGHVSWNAMDRGLTAGQQRFPLCASGRIYPDSFVVDSASVLERGHVSGSVGLSRPDAVDLRFTYDSISLPSVNAWLFGGELPLDSGVIVGYTRLSGFRDNLVSSSELHLRGVAVGDLRPLESDAVITTSSGAVRALPLVLRKGGTVVLTVDTLAYDKRLSLAGSVQNVDVSAFLGPDVLEDLAIEGRVSGSFAASDSGLPLHVHLRSERLRVGEFGLDSVRLSGTADARGFVFDTITARDGSRSRLSATLSAPWSFLGSDVPDDDTLRGSVAIRGDLLASIQENLQSVVGGSGEGSVTASFSATPAGWRFADFSARVGGTLTVGTYIPGGVKNFRLVMSLDDSSRVHTDITGLVGRRPAHVYSSHDVPRGYEPFVFGPLDLGVILAETPKAGVEIHMPGFHDKRELVDVEFAPLSPFKAFAISGPLERLKITGVWILRSCEFTYPLFESGEVNSDWDPFPYVDWEMDITAGSHNVMYYRDLSSKRHKLIRFVEAYIDPTSRISLRGREEDNTFRILGSIRSFKGSVYFGKLFDRRFEVGLDFAPQLLPRGGYTNMPIMWGSAEAFSDTSRMDRVKLTLQLIDPATGGVSERGRVAMIPPGADAYRGNLPVSALDSVPNFVLHLSSDVEQVAGTAERDFYREAGLRFSSLEGAGEFVSTMGEQYLNRYLLQRFEKQLARRMGLDVITVETSIASNYFSKFYNHELAEITDQWNMLALANIGITIGRYFFNDNLFVKARGELVPVDTALVPEYSIGFELQPMRYLFMDFNYGFHKGETSIESDPRLNLQLRLPLTRLRKVLNF